MDEPSPKVFVHIRSGKRETIITILILLVQFQSPRHYVVLLVYLMETQEFVFMCQFKEHESSPKAEKEAEQDDDGQVEVWIGRTQISNFQISAHAQDDHEKYDDRLNVRHLRIELKFES